MTRGETNEIRRLMVSAGYTKQRELAHVIGWSEEHLSRVMSGRKEIPQILRRFLEASATLKSLEARDKTAI